MGLFPGVDQEQDDPDDEVEVRDIGDIGPDFVGATAPRPFDAEGEFHARERMDEIADASENQSVVEVPDSSGDDEPESGMREPVAGFGPLCEEHERDGHRDECEDHEEPALTGPDTEYCSGVEDEGELQEFGDRDDGIVVGDKVAEVLFVQDLVAANVEGEVRDLCEREGFAHKIGDDANDDGRDEPCPCAFGADRLYFRRWGGLILWRGLGHR